MKIEVVCASCADGRRDEVADLLLRSGGAARRYVELDMQFLEQFWIHRAGRFAEEAGAFLGLGEGDDVPDGFLPAQLGYQAVQAQRDAPVRRRPELEGVEQQAELLLLGLGAESHQG